eukprot:GHVN01023844.1.p1 GENE.GHVN01023844.1~~GHVN01023844.1.p1  ORF type:complete len:361 (+),score=73.11 GHVN01023844.1:241-1323(+)
MRKLFTLPTKSNRAKKAQAAMGNKGSCCSELERPPHEVSEDDDSDEEEDDDDVVEDLPDLPPNFNPRKNRNSVSAEAYGDWNKKGLFLAPVYKKTDDQKKRIQETISKSFLFNSLENKDLETVIDAFQEKKITDGVTVIEQGADGDALFLIEQGECNVFKKTAENPDGKLVFVQTPGDAFGELALLYNCPRAATVKAKGECLLWALDRECFNHIVKDAAQRKRELHEAFLAEVSLLKDMDPYERSKLSDALKSEEFKDKQVIIREGDSGDTFYVVESGEAIAEKEGKVVMKYKKGDYFGELALIKDQPRAATVLAKGSCKVVSLNRKSFKRLLGPVEKILERNAERYDSIRRQLSKPLSG